jgi:hypothetical protein
MSFGLEYVPTPMSNRFARWARHAVQWRSFALPVLSLLAVWVAVLYRRAFAVGVLSDGWVLLEIGSQGFRKAPFVLLSYHTIPVTNLLMAVLWKMFGTAERWYQLANLAGFVLVGWLLYLLGCSLFRQARIGLIASLLFLANSSFYEIPFWPTVGNFQSLAAALYLAGVFALHRAFRSPRPWPWVVLFSLCGVAAFFTYEPAVSLLGVGLFYALVIPDEALSWRQRSRRVLTVLIPSLPAFAVVLGSKLYTSLHGYQAMLLPGDWASLKLRVYMLVRACVATFSLVGADNKIYKLLTFGIAPPGGGPLFNALFLVWVLILAVGGALLFWKSRSGAVRFLLLWFAGHMVVIAIASGVVSRHFYLAALPAALLSSWLLWRAADALAFRIARSGSPLPQPYIAAVLAFLAFTLLAINAKTDLDTAGTIHKQASQASQQVASLVQQRLAQSPTTTPKVVLVNMPAMIHKDGIGAYSFVNGLHQLLNLTTGGRILAPELYYTYASFSDGKFASASRPISLSELAARVQDPGTLVLTFDARTQNVTAAHRANWRIPDRYDSGSAPYLEWQAGSWPWLWVYAGQPLELPLAAPAASPWVGVKFLHNSTTSFSMTAGSRPVFEVRRQQIATPRWPSAAFPVPPQDGGLLTSLTVQPVSDVWLAGVWSFSPPSVYTPEVAPFLSWGLLSDPAFTVQEPLDLPLAPPACPDRSCPIRLEYLAEKGREFSVAIAGGPAQEFGFADLNASEWRTVDLAADPGRLAVVRFEPRGTAPVLVRLLAWPPQASQPILK